MTSPRVFPAPSVKVTQASSLWSIRSGTGWKPVSPSQGKSDFRLGGLSGGSRRPWRDQTPAGRRSASGGDAGVHPRAFRTSSSVFIRVHLWFLLFLQCPERNQRWIGRAAIPGRRRATGNEGESQPRMTRIHADKSPSLSGLSFRWITTFLARSDAGRDAGVHLGRPSSHHLCCSPEK